MSTGRIAWLDQARGWGMILVMLGHAPGADLPLKVIYSFHVPLFFAISGWLFDPAKYSGFKDLLRSRGRTLILPYFLFSLIGYAGLAVHWAMGRQPWGLSPTDPILGTILGWRNSSPYNGTLWFVAALVTTEFLFYAISRLSSGNRSIALLLSLVPVVYFFGFRVGLPFPYPWSSDASLVAVAFFAFGHFLKPQSVRSWYAKASGPAGLVVLAVWIACIAWGGKVDMYTVRYDTPVQFVVGACAAILFLFTRMPRVPSLGWVAWIGRRSLVFLALHEWLAFGVARGVMGRFGGLLDTQWGMAITGLCYVAIAMVILWPLTLFLERWAPILVGAAAKGSRKAPA